MQDVFEKFGINNEVKYYTLDLYNVIYKICVKIEKKGEIEYSGPYFETLYSLLPQLGFNVGVKHYVKKKIFGIAFGKSKKETLLISHDRFI